MRDQTATTSLTRALPSLSDVKVPQERVSPRLPDTAQSVQSFDPFRAPSRQGFAASGGITYLPGDSAFEASLERARTRTKQSRLGLPPAIESFTLRDAKEAVEAVKSGQADITAFLPSEWRTIWSIIRESEKRKGKIEKGAEAAIGFGVGLTEMLATFARGVTKLAWGVATGRAQGGEEMGELLARDESALVRGAARAIGGGRWAALAAAGEGIYRPVHDLTHTVGKMVIGGTPVSDWFLEKTGIRDEEDSFNNWIRRLSFTSEMMNYMGASDSRMAQDLAVFLARREAGEGLLSQLGTNVRAFTGNQEASQYLAQQTADIDFQHHFNLDEDIMTATELVSPLDPVVLFSGPVTAGIRRASLATGAGARIEKLRRARARGIEKAGRKMEGAGVTVSEWANRSADFLTEKIGALVGDDIAGRAVASLSLRGVIGVPARATAGIGKIIGDLGQAGIGTTRTTSVLHRAASQGGTSPFFKLKAMRGLGRVELSTRAFRDAGRSGALLQLGLGLSDADNWYAAGEILGTGYGIGMYSVSYSPFQSARSAHLYRRKIELESFARDVRKNDPNIDNVLGLEGQAEALLTALAYVEAGIAALSDADLSALGVSREALHAIMEAPQNNRAEMITEELAKLKDKDLKELTKTQRSLVAKLVNLRAATEVYVKMDSDPKFLEQTIVSRIGEMLDSQSMFGLRGPDGKFGIDLRMVDHRTAAAEMAEMQLQELINKGEINLEKLADELVNSTGMDRQQALDRVRDEKLEEFTERNLFSNSINFGTSEVVTVDGKKKPVVWIFTDNILARGLPLERVITHEVDHAIRETSQGKREQAELFSEMFDVVQETFNADGTPGEPIVKSRGRYTNEGLIESYIAYATTYGGPVDAVNFMSRMGHLRGDISLNEVRAELAGLERVTPEFVKKYGNEKAILKYQKGEKMAELGAMNYLESRSQGIDMGFRDNSMLQRIEDWLAIKEENALARIGETIIRALKKEYGVIGKAKGREQLKNLMGEEVSEAEIAHYRRFRRRMNAVSEYLVADSREQQPEITFDAKEVAKDPKLFDHFAESDIFARDTYQQFYDADGNPEGQAVKVDPDKARNLAPAGVEQGRSYKTFLKIRTDEKGNAVILTPREIRRRSKDRTSILRNAILAADQTGGMVESGPYSLTGIPNQAQLQAIEAIPDFLLSPRMKAYIRLIADAARAGDGQRVIMEYQAALGKRGNYESLSPKIRDEIPIGFFMSRAGNFLVTTISVSRLNDKVIHWAAENRLGLWGGDVKAVLQDIGRYLYNHSLNNPGWTNLDASQQVAMQKANVINDLFNVYTKETKTANPDRISTRKDADSVIRSRRIDRITFLTYSSGEKMPVNYEYIKRNFMPVTAQERAQMESAQKDMASELAFAKRYLKEDGPSIREFDFFEDYEATIEKEISIMPASPRRVLFIGAGSVPLSPALFAMKGLKVDAMEIEAPVAKIGKQAWNKIRQELGGKTPGRIIRADASRWKGYGDYDAIVLALEAVPTDAYKRSVLSNIVRRMNDQAELLVRSDVAGEMEFASSRTLMPEAMEEVGSTPTWGGFGETISYRKMPAETSVTGARMMPMEGAATFADAKTVQEFEAAFKEFHSDNPEKAWANFREWFGESVATHNGQPMSQGGIPLVFYHGSDDAQFTAFNYRLANNPRVEGAFWFATRYDVARGYAKKRGEVEFVDHEAIANEGYVIAQRMEITHPETQEVYEAIHEDRREFLDEAESELDYEGLSEDSVELKGWVVSERYRDVLYESQYSDIYKTEEEARAASIEIVKDSLTDGDQVADGGVYPVFLRFTDPIIFDAEGRNWSEAGGDEFFDTNMLVREGRGMGGDAVIIENVEDPGPYSRGYAHDSSVVVVFDPTAIKWKWNYGDFSPKNPDIRFMPGVPVDPTLQSFVDHYIAANGIPVRPAARYYLGWELAKKIADEYEAAPVGEISDEMMASYKAFTKEIVDQYNMLIERGYQLLPYEGDGEPYKTSREMIIDVRRNKRLYYLQTENALGQGNESGMPYPMLWDSGVRINGKPVPVNDLFRAVHDVLGYAVEGNSFSMQGEYGAWAAHSKMFTDAAIPALTVETVGQNSWFNAGQHIRRGDGSIPAQGDADFVPYSQRPFAQSKTFALSPEIMDQLFQGGQAMPMGSRTPVAVSSLSDADLYLSHQKALRRGDREALETIYGPELESRVGAVRQQAVLDLADHLQGHGGFNPGDLRIEPLKDFFKVVTREDGREIGEFPSMADAAIFIQEQEGLYVDPRLTPLQALRVVNLVVDPVKHDIAFKTLDAAETFARSMLPKNAMDDQSPVIYGRSGEAIYDFAGQLIVRTTPEMRKAIKEGGQARYMPASENIDALDFGDKVDGTGRSFRKFFADATRGVSSKYRPKLDNFVPLADLGEHGEKMRLLRYKYKGMFDEHILTSIPAFDDTQAAVVSAVVRAYPEGADILDIGASEGSTLKAMGDASGGRITGIALNPNQAMQKTFNEKPQVEGIEYALNAFTGREGYGQELWTEPSLDNPDGPEIAITGFNPGDRKFDVVHESMVFQFIDNERQSKIQAVKELLKDDGIFITEEKVKFPEAIEKRNEDMKDEKWKALFYDSYQIKVKRDTVLNKAQQEAAELERRELKDAEAAAVGMSDLLASDQGLKDALTSNFENVVQFWSSGNFVGYVASDSVNSIRNFMDKMADLNTEFSTTRTPVTIKGNYMPMAEGLLSVEGFIESFANSVATEDGRAVKDGGIPIIYYHTTSAGKRFKEFNVFGNDIGIHLGSAAQANARIPHFHIKPEGVDGYPWRTIPLVVNAESILRGVRDYGRWTIENLVEILGPSYEAKTGKKASEFLSRIRKIPGFFTAGTGITAVADAMRKFFKNSGVDAIEYLNRYETGYDLNSETVLDYVADQAGLPDAEFAAKYGAGKSLLVLDPTKVKSVWRSRFNDGRSSKFMPMPSTSEYIDAVTHSLIDQGKKTFAFNHFLGRVNNIESGEIGPDSKFILTGDHTKEVFDVNDKDGMAVWFDYWVDMVRGAESHEGWTFFARRDGNKIELQLAVNADASGVHRKAEDLGFGAGVVTMDGAPTDFTVDVIAPGDENFNIRSLEQLTRLLKYKKDGSFKQPVGGKAYLEEYSQIVMNHASKVADIGDGIRRQNIKSGISVADVSGVIMDALDTFRKLADKAEIPLVVSGNVMSAARAVRPDNGPIRIEVNPMRLNEYIMSGMVYESLDGVAEVMNIILLEELVHAIQFRDPEYSTTQNYLKNIEYALTRDAAGKERPLQEVAEDIVNIADAFYAYTYPEAFPDGVTPVAVLTNPEYSGKVAAEIHRQVFQRRHRGKMSESFREEWFGERIRNGIKAVDRIISEIDAGTEWAQALNEYDQYIRMLGRNYLADVEAGEKPYTGAKWMPIGVRLNIMAESYDGTSYEVIGLPKYEQPERPRSRLEEAEPTVVDSPVLDRIERAVIDADTSNWSKRSVNWWSDAVVESGVTPEELSWSGFRAALKAIAKESPGGITRGQVRQYLDIDKARSSVSELSRNQGGGEIIFHPESGQAKALPAVEVFYRDVIDNNNTGKIRVVEWMEADEAKEITTQEAVPVVRKIVSSAVRSEINKIALSDLPASVTEAARLYLDQWGQESEPGPVNSLGIKKAVRFDLTPEVRLAAAASSARFLPMTAESQVTIALQRDAGGFSYVLPKAKVYDERLGVRPIGELRQAGYQAVYRLFHDGVYGDERLMPIATVEPVGFDKSYISPFARARLYGDKDTTPEEKPQVVSVVRTANPGRAEAREPKSLVGIRQVATQARREGEKPKDLGLSIAEIRAMARE